MTDRRTIEALSEALDDEYKARATYRKVIERFGPVRPFVNIVEAEDRHVAAFLAQFRRLGATPPEDTWAPRVKAPESVEQACTDAVQAEIENDAMYSRLLEQVTDAQAHSVMLRLQDASRNQHLPAFRRCVERGGGGGGLGRGRR
ncbi:MAG: ferritin-like domain-containing protein [Methylocystis sp.]|uniref:ferritin-like domain-containing protein n=1 Tax=Methylocystis sp. TaxID=1911079 RepID=UPI003DA4E4AD